MNEGQRFKKKADMDCAVIPKEERTWAMLAHLSSYLGWIGIPLANIFAPLIIWQVKKEEMPFVAEQAKECLNFQITMTIYAIISGILCIIFIGFVGLIVVLIADIVLTIIAAVKANDGIAYRYPFTFRLIS